MAPLCTSHGGTVAGITENPESRSRGRKRSAPRRVFRSIRAAITQATAEAIPPQNQVDEARGQKPLLGLSAWMEGPGQILARIEALERSAQAIQPLEDRVTKIEKTLSLLLDLMERKMVEEMASTRTTAMHQNVYKTPEMMRPKIAEAGLWRDDASVELECKLAELVADVSQMQDQVHILRNRFDLETHWREVSLAMVQDNQSVLEFQMGNVLDLYWHLEESEGRRGYKIEKIARDGLGDAVVNLKEFLGCHFASLEEAFATLDEASNGVLTFDEFVSGLAKLGFHAGVDYVWRLLDISDSGSLDLSEFLQLEMCAASVGEVSNGVLTFEEFVSGLGKLGFHAGVDYVTRLFAMRDSGNLDSSHLLRVKTCAAGAADPSASSYCGEQVAVGTDHLLIPAGPLQDARSAPQADGNIVRETSDERLLRAEEFRVIRSASEPTMGHATDSFDDEV